MAEEQAEAQQDKAQGDKAPSDVKLPLKMRLKAWWDGEELVVRQKADDAESAQTEEEPGPSNGEAPEWSAERMALVQAVWGEGLCGPAGEEIMIRLTKPVGLTPAMRMLELGAGLGGRARMVAKHFGAWVTGLEADPALAEEGARLSATSEFAKKATVAHFDPAALSSEEPPFDCVLAKEFPFRIEDKKAFLEAVSALTKAPGHLIFTDYVQPAQGDPDPALDEWRAAERIQAQLWTEQDYVEALEELGFDVRVAEDFTGAHKGEITATWAAYLESLQEQNPCGAAPPGLAHEVGLWMRRVKLLEAGHLKVCRVHAVRKETMLSE